MRIVHESSVIGNGFFEQKSRSGVHRALCETSWALNNWSDVTQIAIALTGPHAALGLREALREEPDLLPIPLMESWRWPISLYGQAVKAHMAWSKALRRDQRHHPRRVAAAIATRTWDQFATLAPTNWQDSDLLHSWFFALPSRANSPRRRVITIHDLIPLRHPEWFSPGEATLFASILSSITDDDHIICVSEATRRDLINVLPKVRNRTHVIHLGAHSRCLRLRTPPCGTLHTKRHPTSKPYFLFLGTDEPRKNLGRVLEAYRSGNFRDHDLLIVGATGASTGREKLSEHNIKALGRIPDQDLSTIIQGATALVYPSLYEGFGLPVIEAMAAGIPVITSTTSSLPEIAGTAALLVDPLSSIEISRAMTRIAHDSGLRQELSIKSREHSANFTWSRTAQLHRELYSTLL